MKPRRIKPYSSILHRDRNNLIYQGEVKLCRFVPERGVLEFKTPRHSGRNGGQGRLVEVQLGQLSEFINELMRMIG